MKKLLGIVVLSLLLSLNAYADNRAPIKHKRIECSSNMFPGRVNNSFLIISKDDKTAQLITIPWNTVEKFKVEINKTLLNIKFKLINDWDEYWVLERKTGIIKVYSGAKYSHEKKCEPFPDDFDPEKFLNSKISENVKKVIKENKF